MRRIDKENNKIYKKYLDMANMHISSRNQGSKTEINKSLDILEEYYLVTITIVNKQKKLI